MKALLFSLGTRGDVEPFLGIAHLLRQEGWEVVCVFPEQLRDLVEEEGYPFHGFNREFMDIFIKAETGRMIVSGETSLFKRMRLMAKMIKTILRLTREITDQQQQLTQELDPDYIIYHFKCVYPLIWGLKHPGKSIMVSPFPCTVHPVNNHSVIGFRGGGNYGRWLNRLSYLWQNFFKSIVFYFSTRRFHRELETGRVTPLRIYRAMLETEKSIYPLSPTLFPKPEHWHDRVKVTGHYERPKSQHYTPDPALLDFIERHQKLLFISFGSITSISPELISKRILRVLEKLQIPTLINTSWGGLVQPSAYPDHIFFVERIPYDWILPKVYAVVHHGGAGTTHSALRFGCASLIIPHFIDQFFWAKKVETLQAGPRGMSIKDLREENFSKAIEDLWTNPTYKKSAEQIASNIQSEGSLEGLLSFIRNR